MTVPTTPTGAAPAPAPGPAPAGAAAPVPPAPRRSRTGTVLTAVGITVAALAAAQLAVNLLGHAAARTVSTTAAYAAPRVVELVTDGAVDVRAAGDGEVRVERTSRHAWDEPDYDVQERGDRLVVTYRCGWTWAGVCSTSLAAEVPEGTAVVVRSADGQVRAEGALGDAELRTSDGDVLVTGATGSVEVRTSDGRVDVQDVAGDVLVRTADGDVRLRGVGGDADVAGVDGTVDVDGVDGSLAARTSDGDVMVAAVAGDVGARTVDGDVTVHGTGEPAALEMATVDGRSVIDAPTDPAADRRVVLRTVDGDVAYLGPRR
ncbi:DUF4097 family beta strand repeat-containing protein [Cellulomonas sp.]|uniref:DUF4097 family beta strand repeat-containing protein n=1 Tax=Cellulomonas sp. TaxID=40001 RepID=UPI0028111285|nr:DUF4097 family beta strand repeat-containing protein [Cellulomonas sp.]